MKLIDLLVQELPKRGGWPDGAEIAVQDADSQICFSSHSDVYANKEQTDWYGGDWGDGYWNNPFIDIIADDRHECIVSRKQYESALASSQKPAWNGGGVPPVGCECEYLDSNGKWYPVTIKYASDQLVVISGITKILGVEQGTEIAKDIVIDKPQFRPLRTEAERKRDEAIEAIDWYMPECIPDTPNEFYHAKKIYDAIAAGKIPGVKLED